MATWSKMGTAMTADELSERVQQALTDYTPRHLDHPEAASAAVLLLITDRDGEPHVVFTERTNDVEHHKGQMSFPGGAADDCDDSLAATALRETYEEIGVLPEHVRVVGQLDEMLTISNFRVTPFVGLVAGQSFDYPFVLNEHEVATVVQVPLSFLLEEQNMELEVRQHQGREVLVPAFSYNGHRIWGATARMLHQFIELLR
ncbi:MAG: CoA pyrophosphatase [Dehalococcoidia bacterium]|nr:CoA pyrophosphatase [Dehalococcoidia bacterium]